MFISMPSVRGEAQSFKTRESNKVNSTNLMRVSAMSHFWRMHSRQTSFQQTICCIVYTSKCSCHRNSPQKICSCGTALMLFVTDTDTIQIPVIIDSRADVDGETGRNKEPAWTASVRTKKIYITFCFNRT